MSSILGLLQKMGNRENNHNEADKAFDEFYQLFHLSLFQMSKFICNFSYLKETEEFAADILQDALTEFLANVTRFDASLYEDEESLRNGVLKWIKYLILKHYRKWKDDYYGGDFKKVTYIQEKLALKLWESDISLSDDKTVDKEKLQKRLFLIQILKEEINKLSTTDSLIIRTKFSYGGYMPRKVLADLCEQTGLRPAAIRKRIERIIKRLRKGLVD